MRLVVVLAALVLVTELSVVSAAPPSAVATALATEVTTAGSIVPVCSGCGCRGGPGYRTANGKCASWGRRR